VPTFAAICILVIISSSAGNSDTNADKAVLFRASLSNPHLRSKAVENLAGQSRTAKTSAWRKAQNFGWNVKGQTDGVHFELMALIDGRPIYYITHNVNAAISTAADLIRNTPPYNLNGSSLTVGVWDAGSVLSTRPMLPEPSEHRVLTRRLWEWRQVLRLTPMIGTCRTRRWPAALRPIRQRPTQYICPITPMS